MYLILQMVVVRWQKYFSVPLARNVVQLPDTEGEKKYCESTFSNMGDVCRAA